MIVFAAICPHPPVIVPEIGGQQVSKVKKTVAAMERLAEDFTVAKVDTIIIISPHGPILADRFNVRSAEVFHDLKLPGNQRLARAIANAATGNNLPTELLFSPELDHGISAPLYFLLKNLTYSPTLIPIGFSNRPLDEHYQFGTMIARVCENKPNRIAIIASGDLSHRSVTEFDEKLIELLKRGDAKGIINLDPQLIEEAGECGLRSIVILLGAVPLPTSPPDSSAHSYAVAGGRAGHFSLLSYEAPFGVGYLVARVR